MVNKKQKKAFTEYKELDLVQLNLTAIPDLSRYDELN